MKELISSFFAELNGAPIYAAAHGFAYAWVAGIAGGLFVIMLAVRYFGESVGNIDGSAKWSKFVKDALVNGTALTLYFGLVYMVTGFFMAVNQWSAEHGSVAIVLNSYEGLINSIKFSGEPSMAAAVGNFFGGGVLGAVEVIYLVSYVIVLLVSSFFSIGHAMAFALMLGWGGIAIATNVSEKLSVLKGWAIFMAAVLLWPILENMVMSLLGIIIDSAFAKISLQPDSLATENMHKAAGALILSVVNLLVAAFIVVAPLVAYVLVNNSGAISSMVAPLAGAAALGANVVANVAGRMGGETVQRFGHAGTGLVQDVGKYFGGGGQRQRRPMPQQTGGAPVVGSNIGGGSGGGGGGKGGSAPAPKSNGTTPQKGGHSKSSTSKRVGAAAVATQKTGLKEDMTGKKQAESGGGRSAPGGREKDNSRPSEAPPRRRRKLTSKEQTRRGAIIDQQRKGKT